MQKGLYSAALCSFHHVFSFFVAGNMQVWFPSIQISYVSEWVFNSYILKTFLFVTIDGFFFVET